MKFHKQKMLNILEPSTFADTRENFFYFSQFEQLQAVMMFITVKAAIIQSEAAVQKISVQLAVLHFFIRRCFLVNFQKRLLI